MTLAYALDKDMPVLGLCRGMQMICVYSGATIIQDIPTWFNSKGVTYNYLHRNEKVGDAYRDFSPHDVIVDNENTLLYSICGSNTIKGAPSWHHQAVESIDGTRLRLSGKTETYGYYVIEAVEHIDKTFCLGLQFHPEAALVKHLDNSANASLFMSREEALNYFKRFVEEAKKYKEKRMQLSNMSHSSL